MQCYPELRFSTESTTQKYLPKVWRGAPELLHVFTCPISDYCTHKAQTIFSFYITTINKHSIMDLSVCLQVISHSLHMMLISISKRSFSAEKFCLFVTLGQGKGERVMKVLQQRKGTAILQTE